MKTTTTTSTPNDTRLCERCASPFLASGAKRFCSARCRKRSWDKSHDVYSGAQRRKASGAPRRRVIALDGEGLDGPPRYLMLIGSDGSGVIDPDGLTTDQCLGYLVGLPTEALLWSFSFSYDVNMILGSWPPEVLADLWESISTPGGSCSVTYGRWSVKWIPGKQFTVSDRSSGRRATVWDVWPFVQSSFVEWITADGIATPAEIAEIADMKGERDRLGSLPIERVESYCRSETRLLAAGVTRMLSLFRGAGIQPTSYYGAGSLAATLLRRHDVARYIAPAPRRYRGAVRAAYRGGRFENSFTGWQDAGYLIDINSAYPAAARDLPCLEHTEWRHVDGKPSTPLALCYVEWDTGGELDTWGPFPVPLPDGSLIYPTRGAAWLWSPEVAAAARTFDGVRITEAVELHTSCEHKPFAFIDDLYAERRRLQRDGDPRQKVIKLAINAVYGKLAQTIGDAPTQSFAWAGIITSRCRAQLLRAMWGDPSNVTMIATDGLTVRELPAHLTYGDGLGEWSAQPFTDMLALQPGLYFYHAADGEPVTRSRGFGKAALTYHDAAALMPRGVTPNAAEIVLGRIPVTVRQFTGLGTTVRRREWSQWRSWTQRQTGVSLNPWPRRPLFLCTPDGITSYAPRDIPEVQGDPAEWRSRALENTANADGS